MPAAVAIVNDSEAELRKKITEEIEKRLTKQYADAEKQRRKDARAANKKLPPGVAYRALFDELAEDHSSPESALEAVTGYKIGAYEIEPGIKQFILFTQSPLSECIPVNLSRAQHLFLDYVGFIHPHDKNYIWTAEQAMSYAKYHYARAQCVTKPALIRSFDDPYTCFTRIPWALEPNPGGTKTPLFNEFLKRVLTNKRAFKAFIWSIFELKSFSQQYLYIEGDGNDGKGALGRVLLRLLGRVGRVQSTLPEEGNKHRYTPYLNKRLVVFTDLPKDSSLSDGAFKALTGNDPVYIDPKGKEGFDALLECKIILLSNHPAELDDGGKADMRRPIICKMQTTDEFDAYYEQKLWGELKYFLHDCREEYMALAPSHGKIATDKEQEDLLKEELDNRRQDFVHFFDKNLVEVDAKRSGDDFDPATYITPQALRNRLFAKDIKSPKTISKFLSWLKNARGYEAVREDSTAPRLIHGLQLRLIADIPADI